jgi:hypothetical protein
MSNFGKAKKEAINALKMKSILNDHNNTTVKEMSNAQKTAKDILESGKGSAEDKMFAALLMSQYNSPCGCHYPLRCSYCG